MAKKLLFVFNPFAGKGLVKENLCDLIDKVCDNACKAVELMVQGKTSEAMNLYN